MTHFSFTINYLKLHHTKKLLTDTYLQLNLLGQTESQIDMIMTFGTSTDGDSSYFQLQLIFGVIQFANDIILALTKS